jgi:hypothetical protein
MVARSVLWLIWGLVAWLVVRTSNISSIESSQNLWFFGIIALGAVGFRQCNINLSPHLKRFYDHLSEKHLRVVGLLTVALVSPPLIGLGFFLFPILLLALTYNPALAGVLIVFEVVIAWYLKALLACVPYEIRRITRRS